MKKAKLIVSLIAITMLLTTSFSYAKDVYVNDMFTIEKEKIDENSEFFKADITYPHLKVKGKYLSNKDNVKTIENINKEISDYIIEFKDKIKEESVKYEKQYKEILSKSEHDYIKYQYEAYSNYEVAYNKNNLLSIPINTYEFTGGANGINYTKSFNYDLLTGKEITLDSILKECKDYKEIINKHISEEINKTNEKYKNVFFTGKDGFNGISDDQSFYITDDGIVIYFRVNEIAPHYVGIPKFTIKWEEFGDCLKMN